MIKGAAAEGWERRRSGCVAHHEDYVGDRGDLLADGQLPRSHACLVAGHMSACLHHLDSVAWLGGFRRPIGKLPHCGFDAMFWLRQNCGLSTTRPQRRSLASVNRRGNTYKEIL